MIVRFSLYGFLKNLRLFEAFLLLALREHGLSFAAIGALIAVREVAINVFEVPTGAVADALGRRRAMVAGMAAYVVAYLVLGLSTSFWPLAGAMVLYGLGDAFRSGTHKALIFTWLRAQGRQAERTRVYGLTRSWSKVGSAVSALIGAALVFGTERYAPIFLWSAVPAALNLINLSTYPRWLDDRPPTGRPAWLASALALRDGVLHTVRRASLRRLVLDSLAFEGGYAAVKDYLQPVVVQAALALPLLVTEPDARRSAALLGVVYASQYLLASAASRGAHRVHALVGSADIAALRLGHLAAGLLVALVPLLLLGATWPAIGLLLCLTALQNLWLPIHLGRFDEHGEERWAATVLSVQAQAKSIATAALAPLIGLLVDRAAAGASPVPLWALWPVGLGALPWLLLSALRRASRAG